MEKPFSWKYELRSKLMDGVLPGVALYLLVMMVTMGAGLVQSVLGGLGALLMGVSLLAVGMFSLHRALIVSSPEPTRAWYGMASGALLWAVTSLMLATDGDPSYGMSNIILLIMGGLVVAQLWEGNLSTGGRFFAVTLLLHWGVSVVVYFLNRMATMVTLQPWIRQSWGWVVVGAAVIIFAWMMVRSQTRLQRTWAALLIVALLFFAFALGMN